VRTTNQVPQIATEPPADSVLPGTPEAHKPPKRTGRPPVVTSTPETAPPGLLCPTCDRPLVYRRTVIGGVKPLERWDYFECGTCGAFVYRDRTRKLRPTS